MNAIEHLRLRNFRLALLEAIVCLEIVISQFLENYCLLQRGFSKNRLKKVFKGEVGLTARVGLLLELTLNPNDLKVIRIGEILKAISWRNKIVHETGHLPATVSEDEISDCIMSVLYAAHSLSRKRDEIVAAPELGELAQAIAEAWTVPVPRLIIAGRHRVICQFVFFLSHEFPDEANMTRIVEELSQRLEQRDLRFRREEHLYVSFSEFSQDTIAVWSNGRLDVRGKPHPRLPRRPPSLEPPPAG